MEHADSTPPLSTFPPAQHQGRRSASMPTMSAFRISELASEETTRAEAKFLNFGDHVALYSEDERNPGFVSTLG